jgi:hypothetical protein
VGVAHFPKPSYGVMLNEGILALIFTDDKFDLWIDHTTKWEARLAECFYIEDSVIGIPHWSRSATGTNYVTRSE